MDLLNPHVKLVQKDAEGNKRQVFPQTDVQSVIGLGSQKGSLLDRINEIDRRLKAIENKVNYH